MEHSTEIAIIGAGPAGLFAAEQLATAGHAVALYDHMPSPARKLLIAGRGGLNLTHSEPLESFLPRYGDAEHWLAPMIRAFPPSALRAWCEGLGEATFVGSSGRVFPRSMKAAPLLRAWLRRLESLGVTYHPRHRWLGWHKGALHLSRPDGTSLQLQPAAILLALGGASWPRLGSTGSWVEILGNEGISISPLRPANCGFTIPWSEHLWSRFAGTPLKPVSLTHQGITRQGEALITSAGIEGGLLYSFAAPLRSAIEASGHTLITLDLRPQTPITALTEKLSAPRASKSLSTYLGKLGFSPLAIALLRETTPAAELNSMSPAALAGRIKALPLPLTGTTGIARAISSAGGIPREAVDDSLMLHAKPGTFVAGEMLDWEAPTGGYLLQACFSTAARAARGIIRYCAHQNQPEYPHAV